MTDFILIYCLVNFSAFLNALRCSLSSCVKTILENKIAVAFLNYTFRKATAILFSRIVLTQLDNEQRSAFRKAEKLTKQ